MFENIRTGNLENSSFPFPLENFAKYSASVEQMQQPSGDNNFDNENSTSNVL